MAKWQFHVSGIFQNCIQIILAPNKPINKNKALSFIVLK